MFGNNGITSSWGQPQQNQQQNTTSAFGQPAAGTSAFGSGTGTFGSGGAFGQPAQPQANPMFGSAATPAPGGFGSTPGFGSTNTANTGGGMFGQNKPATGFGSFGGGSNAGTSAFGATPGAGTSAFGTTNNGGGSGLFGNPANTSSGGAFGNNGGSMFGGAKPPATFGSTPSNNPNASPYDGVAPVTTGTSNPLYAPFDDKDATATNNSMLHYQSISCMPSYRGSSFEELRCQDYNQGRKTASAGGGFGQSAFGQPAQQPAGSSLFGPNTNSQPTTSAFGGGSAFGGNTTANAGATGGFGSFGQPANNQPAAGTSAFGSFSQPNQQPQQQSTGFGAFGQTQQQQQQQQPQASTSGGLFGGGAFSQNNQNQPKPFTPFGATNGTGTNAFSGGATSAFGQQNPQQNTGGGLFGQNTQQQPAQPSGFGAFGTNNNNQQKTSLFGTQPPTTGTSAFGSFGTQPQQNQQQGSAGSGLFGGGTAPFGQNNQQNQQQQQQQPAQNGLFGNTQQNQPSGGLFGGTTGGLFGNNQNQQPNQQQPGTTNAFGAPGGLFGPKPAITNPVAGTNLFGGFSATNNNSAAGTASQPTGGLFGNLGTSTNNQTATNAFGAGGGLFGGKPAGTTFGATPSTQASSTLGGGSFFGGSTFGGSTAVPTAPQQGSLTASIAQPIGTTLPFFMAPQGARATMLEPTPKKKSYFAELPIRTPQPRIQLNYQPTISRLRGFGVSTSNSSGLLTSGKPHALSLSKTNGKSIGPEAFLNGSVSSPGLGSGSRQSVKKLVLDKRVKPSDLFVKSGISNAPKITFNPALSVSARELEATAGLSSSNQRTDSPAPAIADATPRRSNRFTADAPESVHNSPTKSSVPLEKESQPVKLQEGDYYVKPDLEVLKRKSYDELSSFEGLVVGRVGYGEIHFLESVDLTGLPKLGALLGELVRFDDKECSVYPDSEDVDKPLPGSGLNVKARIILIRCWPVDKASREPIKDETHPSLIRHIRRLKHIKDTQFESYVIEEGKWTFCVEHF